MAIATSNVLNEVYNDKFGLEFSVSMLKETIALVHMYICTYVYIHAFISGPQHRECSNLTEAR